MVTQRSPFAVRAYAYVCGRNPLARQFYPLRMGINQPIANVLKEGQPGQIAGEVFRYGDALQSQGEFITGAVPTVSGGTEQSLKPTTYISDKESALGRMFTAWLHLKFFWAGLMCKSVKDYARWAGNATRDAVDEAASGTGDKLKAGRSGLPL